MDAVRRIGQRWASGSWLVLDASDYFGCNCRLWIALDCIGLHWTYLYLEATDASDGARRIGERQARGLWIAGSAGGVGSGVGWRFDWDRSVVSRSIALGV